MFEKIIKKHINKLVTADKFEDRDVSDYIYGSISQPPLKVVSKNDSDDELDYTVNCPTCGTLRIFGTELYMLSGYFYCDTVGCMEKCKDKGGHYK